MIQVDYIFYVEEYHGTLIDDEESLKLPVLKANTYLNQVLRRKPQGEEVEQIQFCLCEAAELIYQDEINRREHGGREVQSESTDGYSVTYAAKGTAGDPLQEKVYAVIRRYLSHTGLLYQGVR